MPGSILNYRRNNTDFQVYYYQDGLLKNTGFTLISFGAMLCLSTRIDEIVTINRKKKIRIPSEIVSITNANTGEFVNILESKFERLKYLL